MPQLCLGRFALVGNSAKRLWHVAVAKDPKYSEIVSNNLRIQGQPHQRAVQIVFVIPWEKIHEIWLFVFRRTLGDCVCT